MTINHIFAATYIINNNYYVPLLNAQEEVEGKIEKIVKRSEEYCISGKEAREREKVNVEYEELNEKIAELEKRISIMQKRNVRNFNDRESITRALEAKHVSERLK